MVSQEMSFLMKGVVNELQELRSWLIFGDTRPRSSEVGKQIEDHSMGCLDFEPLEVEQQIYEVRKPPRAGEVESSVAEEVPVVRSVRP